MGAFCNALPELFTWRFDFVHATLFVAGRTIEAGFSNNETLSDVHRFVAAAYLQGNASFVLCTPYPVHKLEGSELAQTVVAAGPWYTLR